MGAVLYNKEKEMKIVPVHLMANHLADGWVADLNDLKPKKRDEPSLSNAEIRQMAKEKGIEDYEKMRVGTLRSLLGID